MTDDIVEAARRIESNPLGRIMYGQRELFHSNLLAWFFEEMPDFADRVFQPFTLQGEGSRRHVDRERGNLDIVLHWDAHAPLVIENKVFAIPTAEQLDRYSVATASWKTVPTLLLLSVSAPSFTADGWRHLTYRELAERIRSSAPSAKSYEVETMLRYAQLAEDLHSLVAGTEVRDREEPVWLTPSVLTAVSSSQMRAALHKARAQRVAQLINASIPDLEKPAASGMTNATPLVEALEYVDTEGMHIHLGWQLQGAQFRRAVVYHDKSITGRTQKSRLQRELVSEKNLHFFRFPTGLGPVAAGKKAFNHYAPSFVYRYVKAPTLTIGELLDAASEIHAEVIALSEAGSGQQRPDHAVRRTP
jgi:hypothetical protein